MAVCTYVYVCVTGDGLYVPGQSAGALRVAAAPVQLAAAAAAGRPRPGGRLRGAAAATAAGCPPHAAGATLLQRWVLSVEQAAAAGSLTGATLLQRWVLSVEQAAAAGSLTVPVTGAARSQSHPLQLAAVRAACDHRLASSISVVLGSTASPSSAIPRI